MQPPDHAPTGPPKRTFRLWEMRSAADGEQLLRQEAVELPSFVWLEGDHAFVGVLRHDRMKVFVGRSPNAELPIPTNKHTQGVSRRHATIERHYDQLTIRDTSSNGTKVNGIPVSRDGAALNDRDTIELAGVMTIIVRCPVLEVPGTFNLPAAPNWTALTPTQLRVVVALLDLREQGTSKPPSNEQIAQALGVGTATVKTHIGKALEALDAKGRRREWLAQLALTHEFALREAHTAANG